MSDCKTCLDEKVLSYYGECVVCVDCSDGLKIYDYIKSLKAENEKLMKIHDDASRDSWWLSMIQNRDRQEIKKLEAENEKLIEFVERIANKKWFGEVQDDARQTLKQLEGEK